MSVEEVVKVTITRESASVSEAGFGTMGALAPVVAFTDRVQFHTKDSYQALFDSTDPVRVALDAYFAQEPKPQQAAVLRQQVDSLTVSVDAVANDTTYTATVNDIDYTFLSDATATIDEITAGLVAAIDVDPNVDATDNVDGTYDVDALVPGTAFSFSLDTLQSLNLTFATGRGSLNSLVSSETTADALTAIAAQEQDWYALIGTSIQTVDEDARAAHIETQRKLHFTSSSDTNIINQTLVADSTSVAARFRTKSYARSAVLYAGKPEEFSDAAWFGKGLPSDPGSINWAYQTLAGVSRDNLTPTQRKNALDKNANIYTDIKGIGQTRLGTVAEPEFIDVIRGVDALQADIEESVFARFAALDRIPYTNPGANIIVTEVQGSLGRSAAITDDPKPTVTAPNVRTVAFNKRAGRSLPDIKFTGTLTGAINDVEIDGTVSV